MTINKHISLKHRARSFLFAGKGILAMLNSEPNAQIHLMATVGVVTGGLAKGLTGTEWMAIVFAIAMVWVAESFNTAIEKLCDYSCNKNYHPAIKMVKDLSAGAVLIAAVCSIVIGIMVFIR